MSGTRSANPASDTWAAGRLQELMAHRGWTAKDVAEASRSTGHPDRCVSTRTVYRVLSDGYVPGVVARFEIAAAFGLIPPHIWGRLPIPDEALFPVFTAAPEAIAA